ncbi:unnamed protein product [Phytophthora fragariaefolia]|uniref:Unnamed protein product n=1 Tax=Phytophthora fragariaefolia TaxID=1490495 RepID=A0A9W6Y199_9STRA|nr:unnamed protein product [Phytophthora fragariaefolia]
MIISFDKSGADFSASWPLVGGASGSTTIYNQTARGAFVSGVATANGIIETWNYMVKVKLTDLHPIFRKLDLMANPQIRLHFRVNHGTSVVAVDSFKNMSLTSTTLASGDTCPVKIASAASGNPMSGVLGVSAGFSFMRRRKEVSTSPGPGRSRLLSVKNTFCRD